MFNEIFESQVLINYFIIPALICLARICDVSLGTIRIITVSKGMRSLATGLAFFEIIIWLFSIGQIMQNLTNIANYIAYATGYAVGNYVGIYIEEKLSLGTIMLRIITKKKADELIAFLKSAGYGVTILKGAGGYGPVDVIFTIVKRREYTTVVGIINKFNPNAVYTVEEVKHASTSPYPLAHKDKKDYLDSLLQPLFQTMGFSHMVLDKLRTNRGTPKIGSTPFFLKESHLK
jgi:uncharacterized protein YebE (UPF0316 family)